MRRSLLLQTSLHTVHTHLCLTWRFTSNPRGQHSFPASSRPKLQAQEHSTVFIGAHPHLNLAITLWLTAPVLFCSVECVNNAAGSGFDLACPAKSPHSNTFHHAMISFLFNTAQTRSRETARQSVCVRVKGASNEKTMASCQLDECLQFPVWWYALSMQEFVCACWFHSCCDRVMGA